MHVIRLIYASRAREGLAYSDFVEIMRKASVTNETLGITGMLCHGDGQFLQALEGERSLVNTLYDHITNDPRHSDCVLLQVVDIDHRDFPEWSMKMIDWKDAQAARQEPARAFAPVAMRGDVAAGFLRDIAVSERLLLE